MRRRSANFSKNRKPPSKTKSLGTGHSGKGLVRIIAGKWRGRKLAVPNVQGLRPTPDRIRETVFNWLTGIVDEADCLDLFCGSGALGFEAASRGANSVELVDQDSKVVAQVELNLTTLEATNIKISQTKVVDYLESQAAPKDIVFIDPPFGLDLVGITINQLESNGWLKINSFIYLETEAELVELHTPEHWVLHRQKKSGEVFSRLYLRGAPSKS